jgi:hypothetical protein
MIIVGHARCQVIEGSEIEYPSAVARCEQRMEPGLPQAVVACLVKDRLQSRGTVIPQAEVEIIAVDFDMPIVVDRDDDVDHRAAVPRPTSSPVSSGLGGQGDTTCRTDRSRESRRRALHYS